MLHDQPQASTMQTKGFGHSAEVLHGIRSQLSPLQPSTLLPQLEHAKGTVSVPHSWCNVKRRCKVLQPNQEHEKKHHRRKENQDCQRYQKIKSSFHYDELGGVTKSLLIRSAIDAASNW